MFVCVWEYTNNYRIVYICLFIWVFFETGSLCVVLAVLKVAIYIRLTYKFVGLSLPNSGIKSVDHHTLKLCAYKRKN